MFCERMLITFMCIYKHPPDIVYKIGSNLTSWIYVLFIEEIKIT